MKKEEKRKIERHLLQIYQGCDVDSLNKEIKNIVNKPIINIETIFVNIIVKFKYFKSFSCFFTFLSNCLFFPFDIFLDNLMTK